MINSKTMTVVPVSLGYNRVRFLKRLFLGDTITLRYTVDGMDTAKNCTLAKIEVTNEKGRNCC